MAESSKILPAHRSARLGVTAKYGLALLLLLVVYRLAAQTMPSETGQTGASTVEFNRPSESSTGVEGRVAKGSYIVKSELLATLDMSEAEFEKLPKDEIQRTLRLIYGLPSDADFELIVVDTPEEALFGASISPVALRVIKAFVKYLDDNPTINTNLMARFKAAGDFTLNVDVTVISEKNEPCVDVSAPAYASATVRGPTIFFCLNNLKYISSLFGTIAVAPLIEPKYLPQGILPVMQLYNDAMAKVEPSRRLDQEDPHIPCDLVVYLYTTVKTRVPTQCISPTLKLKTAASKWFGSPDGTWVVNLPFLFNAVERKELPWVALRLRTRNVEDSFYAFVFLHEIGHIVNGDLEQDSFKPEQDIIEDEKKADRFAFDMISNIPELAAEKLAIFPALQVYFTHLKTAIASNGGSKDSIAGIDERYRTSFQHYIEVQQASFEAAKKNASINPKDLAYRRSEFCWTMRLRDDCEPKEALQRAVPALPSS